MPRAKSGVVRKRRVKNILNKTKGAYGGRSKLIRTAKNVMFKSLSYAYIGRKQKKRNFRQLWIARINGVCRTEGISYSQFMHGLDKAGVLLNRKTLANLAATDQDTFLQLIELSKKSVK